MDALIKVSSINGRIGEGQLIAKRLCINAMLNSNGPISGFKIKSSGKFAGGRIGVGYCPSKTKSRRIRCQFNNSSNYDEYRAARNSHGGDADFVNSTLIDAVEVKNGSEGFMIKMRDGRYLKCIYNHPRGGYPPDYISHPAMVFKLEDGTDVLLLPIIVLQTPSVFLRAALSNDEMARPLIYKIVTEMVETMGYMVKYVRVTKRVHDVYFAELCVVKINDETDSHRFDLRPSDAINIAVRCKAPIQVSKRLAHYDGLRVVEPANSPFTTPLSHGSSLLEMDRPDEKSCLESKEFVLVRNMLSAAVEERYHDAAQWKALLKQLRSREKSGHEI